MFKKTGGLYILYTCRLRYFHHLILFSGILDKYMICPRFLIGKSEYSMRFSYVMIVIYRMGI